ncbi:MAG: hypothetical protein R2912_09440 [Eubacteriales bacterium]
MFGGMQKQLERSYRVYMVSSDNGKTFTETGRCPLEKARFATWKLSGQAHHQLRRARINDARNQLV